MMEPASFLEVSATKHSSFVWEEQDTEMSSEPQGAGKLRYEDCTVPETSDGFVTKINHFYNGYNRLSRIQARAVA